jgi:hypothetical protein
MIDPLGDADVPDIDEETSPAEAHDRWEQETNLEAPQLRAVRDDPRNDEYLETASDGREESDRPIPGGPLDDAIHLAETPADEWGAEEKAEAEEALNYKARTLPQYGPDEGEPLLPDEDPDFHTGEWALVRWGFAPEEDDAAEVLK